MKTTSWTLFHDHDDKNLINCSIERCPSRSCRQTRASWSTDSFYRYMAKTIDECIYFRFLLDLKMLIKITWSYQSVELSGEIVDASTVPSCSQSQLPSSQQTAAGFEPKTFSICMPQQGTLTNGATSLLEQIVLHFQHL